MTEPAARPLRRDDSLPPLPSEADTARGLRFLRLCLAAGLGFFLLFLPLYGPESPLLRWGRSHSTAWTVLRAAELRDEAGLRGHDGRSPADRAAGAPPQPGRVVWALGSSVLRESFDEDVVNSALEAQDSPFRLRKLGQNRGAPALTAPLLAQLPVQPGDLILHNVALDHFRSDWLGWTKLPKSALARLADPATLWAVEDRGLPHRLEQAAAIPPRFWAWHDEVMGGYTAWLLGLGFYFQVPKDAKGGSLLRFHTFLRAGKMRPQYFEAERARYTLTAADLDLSPNQINAVGLRSLREGAAARGATLVLIDVPTSAWDQWVWQDEGARAAWDGLRASWPELVVAPQLDDVEFYDRRHPNRLGRAELSAWLAGWIDAPTPGSWARPPKDGIASYPWSELADQEENTGPNEEDED
jgi:hypothetical protein